MCSGILVEGPVGQYGQIVSALSLYKNPAGHHHLPVDKCRQSKYEPAEGADDVQGSHNPQQAPRSAPVVREGGLQQREDLK